MTSPVWICRCGCGKKVVRLRRASWTEATKKDWKNYIVCYARTWDGNPWYTGNPPRHRRPQWKRYVQSLKATQDPFFDL